MSGKTRQNGLTLVEFIVTVSILTAVVTVGIPGIRTMAVDVERRTAIMEFASSIRYARNEAARRGTSISICPSDDGSTCSSDESPDWHDGWVIFTDQDGDGALEAGDETVYVVRFKHPGFNLVGDGNTDVNIRFRSDGFLRVGGTLGYSDSLASRSLVLTRVGRLSVNVVQQGDA